MLFILQIKKTSSKIIFEVVYLKKIIVFMCIFLCMSSIVFGVEDTLQNESDETTVITPSTYEFKTLKGEVVEAGEVYEKTTGNYKEKCQDIKV